jgi:predicted peptidase
MKAGTSLFLTAAVLFGLAPAVARAGEAKTGFLDRVHKDADGKEAKYVLFVPHDYKGDKAYPVILFLHGSGETGTDGKKQATNGLGKAVKAREKDFPFIIVFPQSQKRTWKAGSEDADRALAILDEVMKEYKTDPKRVYLTGLSMGGSGTWSLAAKYPDRWAAIVPICGSGDLAAAKVLKDLPCWCFVGDKDRATLVENNHKLIDALKDAGGKPKFTEYPNIGHNSWDKAYATKELYDWLLTQKKK